MWEEGERTEIFPDPSCIQSGEEKAQAGILSMCKSTSCEEVKKIGVICLSMISRYRTSGNEHKLELGKRHLNLSKWGWPSSWAFAKRFYGVSVLGGFPNLIGYVSELSDIVAPALSSMRWTRKLPEIPTSPSSYVCIIWSNSPCSSKWNTGATCSLFSWLPWMQMSLLHLFSFLHVDNWGGWIWN